MLFRKRFMFLVTLLQQCLNVLFLNAQCHLSPEKAVCHYIASIIGVISIKRSCWNQMASQQDPGRITISQHMRRRLYLQRTPSAYGSIHWARTKRPFSVGLTLLPESHFLSGLANKKTKPLPLKWSRPQQLKVRNGTPLCKVFFSPLQCSTPPPLPHSQGTSQHHRCPFGKIDGPGKWNETHLNQGHPCFSKPT